MRCDHRQQHTGNRTQTHVYMLRYGSHAFLSVFQSPVYGNIRFVFGCARAWALVSSHNRTFCALFFSVEFSSKRKQRWKWQQRRGNTINPLLCSVLWIVLMYIRAKTASVVHDVVQQQSFSRGRQKHIYLLLMWNGRQFFSLTNEPVALCCSGHRERERNSGFGSRQTVGISAATYYVCEIWIYEPLPRAIMLDLGWLDSCRYCCAATNYHAHIHSRTNLFL